MMLAEIRYMQPSKEKEDPETPQYQQKEETEG